jgi:acyl-CoA thioester hydrolase
MSTYHPEIRFVDMDAMGHINNATYFTYLEQARIDYFKTLRAERWDWIEEGVVVAKNELNYQLPIFFGDVVQIETTCSHIGNKSLTLSSKIFKVKEGQRSLAAFGSCVLVCFNHKTQTTHEVPLFWREILEKEMAANE